MRLGVEIDEQDFVVVFGQGAGQGNGGGGLADPAFGICDCDDASHNGLSWGVISGSGGGKIGQADDLGKLGFPGLQAGGLEAEADLGGAEGFEALGDSGLGFIGAIEEHIPAAACAADLATQGAQAAGFAVHFIDQWIGDGGGHFLFVDPGFVQEQAEVFQAALEQGVLGLDGKLFDAVHGGDDFFLTLDVALGLTVNDLGREAGAASVKEHQAVVELVEDGNGDAQRVDNDPVAVKFHQVEATKGGGVLVLAAAFDAQVEALDLVSQGGDLVAGEWDGEPLAEDADDGDDDGGGGAEAGAGRGVGVEEEVETLAGWAVFAGMQAADGSLDQVELAIVHQGLVEAVLGDGLVIERLDGDSGLVAQAQGGVGVFIDGCVEHQAAAFIGVGGDVGAAAGEADAEGGLGAVNFHLTWAFIRRVEPSARPATRGKAAGCYRRGRAVTPWGAGRWKVLA